MFEFDVQNRATAGQAGRRQAQRRIEVTRRWTSLARKPPPATADAPKEDDD